ncbi:rhomboid family intramembrane serine protease [Streptococcus suis]|uniref:Rhomboid family intramembrane serine protease n=1 Tax=Streptococcus suivaginalis TaxID=3028082 RepID=A0AA97A9V0_9STRE|nr:rhomboid family intramembrane serine protease [Streptococcus sp. 29896]MCK4026769.1 rhomboid family intramembrane serine protease [Streptococcus suis]WNY46971.1 rhomboid family intramembrane serine protease [Streptococcus sp. 29896]
MKNFFDKRYPVTNALLAVTALVFLLIQVFRFGQTTTAYTIFEFGGMYGQVVRYDPTQLWRLISPIFVHIGWEHFLFNSFTLYALGYQLEPLFGSRRFFLLYLLSGIMGNVFVYFFTPGVVGAGASTSLFGLFAAMGFLRYYSRSAYLQLLGQRYTALLLINLALGLFNPAISMAGHIGGAIGGCLAVVCLPPRLEKQTFTAQQTGWALVGYLLLFFGLLFVGFLF